MKRLPTALFAALIVSSTATAFAADKPKAPFEVVVTTPEGAPVEGADVVITSPATEPPYSFSALTDAAGKAAGALPDFTHVYSIKVGKGGYKEFTQEIDFAAKKLKKGESAALKVSLPLITAAEYYNEGAKAVQAKDFPLAQMKMEQAIAADSKLVLAYAAIAQVHLAQAEKGWQEQMKKDGKIEAGADLAALARQHAESALAATDQALALDPNDVLALNGRYEALGDLGRKDEAEAALAAVAAKDRTPGTAVLLYNAGAVASNAQQLDVARRHFEEALAINPTLHQAHSGLAELDIREQKFEDAVAELTKAIEIAPRNFKAHDRRIEVLKKIGDKNRIATAEQELAKLKAGS